jgi:hypothetical protein
MEPITLEFAANNLGRIEFDAYVLTGNRKSLNKVNFKLDSGSDFTTISCDDLEVLGYTNEYLQSCPYHHAYASAASEEKLQLQYISNVPIKFYDREIQGCRIFFSRGTKLRSLFGSDILKYFNWSVNYDTCTLQLSESTNKPTLAPGETTIHIYTVEQN